MARKKKVEAAPTEEEIQQAVTEGIIDTVGILHTMFVDTLQANGTVIQAALKGAVSGYLDVLVEQKMIAIHSVVCDEHNNYEDDEVPFIEVNFGFDLNNLEDYISLGFGSDEAIEEWQDENQEEGDE